MKSINTVEEVLKSGLINNQLNNEEKTEKTVDINSYTPILNLVKSPDDVKKLSAEELKLLCDDIRTELISTASKVGGHFASSLGVVEMTVALHKVFNTPRDLIVWDVGHQAYGHKILTGRRERMSSIRKYQGLSGFPKRNESNYDTFGVAHAGTSISAGLGMIEALSKDEANKDRHVVVVIGDGAMTSGMAFEALNHAGNLHKKLIVILNDNEMSISPNVGVLSLAFSKAVSNSYSTSARKHFKSLVEKGLIPKTLYRALDRAEEAAQGFLSTPAMLFNSFGFRYFGPIDGHNLNELEYALEKAKDQDSPVVIHALTTKGKGYQFAEEDPVKWHGVTPFNVEQGEIFTKKAPPSFTSIFADTLIDICKNNKKVVGITAAMPEGTGLSKLAKECPEQFYDVAIAEQHGVTFAAGLCCEGIKPVVAIYSTFLQRAFDQIMHDVCIQNLPVMFALDRGGLVGADGPTHHGVFDLSYLRCLPNMVVSAPKDEYELKDLIHTGVEHNDSPFAVRYPRANCKSETVAYQPKKIEIGRGEIIQSGSEVALLGLGITVGFCEEAAKILENSGIFPTIINARFVKPLDSELILKIAGEHKLIFTVEDQTIVGGFGSAVCELLADKGLNTRVIRLGVPDRFIDHGTQAELYSECGFDAKSIAVAVLNQIRSI